MTESRNILQEKYEPEVAAQRQIQESLHAVMWKTIDKAQQLL